MFYGCESLTSINLSNFITKNVESMDWMFMDCYSLTSIDLSNFITTKVDNMDLMFSQCISLKYIDISQFTTREEEITLFKGLPNEGTIKANSDFINKIKEIPENWEKIVL